MRTRVKHFWSSEIGLSALLVALVLTVFVLRPLTDLGLAGGRLIEAAFSLVLLLGGWSVWGGRARMVLVCIGVGGAGALRWMHWLTGSERLAPWAALASALTICIFIMLVLVLVFQPGPVTGRRIQGAIVAYLLFALAWAQFYECVETFAPGAFTFSGGGGTATGWFSPLLYFSFITLTTLGYGDILPAHPAARSLATMEALIGQLYPAILIGRLVSLHASGTDTAAD
ncbi:MAG TPA: potassium channel family protein [Candidatus Sulfotelmatobacter sp.]|nr:potassium channel family protein [Candidatus Sulfotelmatobacter sp.]